MGAPIQVVTNTVAGNFVLDGAYIDIIAAQNATPQGPDTALVGVVGTGSWGDLHTPIPFSGGGATGVNAAFGANTSLNRSLTREALSAMPEANQFVGVRVSDGTDVEAIIEVFDTVSPTGSAHIVLNLTAVCTGSYPNAAASCRVDLQSGTPSVSPVYTITVFFPGVPAQVWNNVIGYATVGGAYNATAFQANALAAINGTGANRVASPYFVATAGASTNAVQTATPYYATGGTDGASGVTDATLIGTDNGASSTGLYCLRGQVRGGQVVLADFQTPAEFQTVATFCLQELTFSGQAFAAGTETPTAVSTKASNAMSSDYMVAVEDWLEVYDSYQQAEILVSPLGKFMGVLASLPPWQYPGNFPTTGVVGVITTDRLSLGALGVSEAGQREANYISWIGITPNNVLGIPQGLTSSGIQISDVRMRNYLGVEIGNVLGQFCGKMLETTLPIAQADENDPRIGLTSALHNLLQPMVQVNAKQISAYQVIINDANNTQATMQEGFLLAAVAVTTLTGVRFAVAAVQVGNTVQIQTTSLNSFAA